MPDMSLAQKAYIELRERITSGKLPANSHLIEEQLCSTLGVSRTPLRTALRQLADEGYIFLNRNKSAVVKSCTLDDIIQVFEVSEYVDASVAAHLSRLREVGALSDADINELFELNAQMSAALANGDLPRWAEVDASYHSRLIDLCQNPYLILSARPLRTQLERGLWFYTLRIIDLSASTHEHELLIQCIADSDTAGAADAAALHCRRTRAELSTVCRNPLYSPSVVAQT